MRLITGGWYDWTVGDTKNMGDMDGRFDGGIIGYITLDITLR